MIERRGSLRFLTFFPFHLFRFLSISPCPVFFCLERTVWLWVDRGVVGEKKSLLSLELDETRVLFLFGSRSY